MNQGSNFLEGSFSNRDNFENIISGIKFNNEQYHHKLKHSCNLDKKQRSKTNVFVNKTIYSAYTCKNKECAETCCKPFGMS